MVKYRAMKCEREFLNPQVPLVLEVAQWLGGEARRSAAGVAVLDFMMVVVPTQQAGRRLRQALAETLGACVPPRIVLPAQLVVASEETGLEVASEAEELGLLAKFLTGLRLEEYGALFPNQETEGTFAWALGVARQLRELWGILGENGLLMTDVAERIGEIIPDEMAGIEEERWWDLARIEEAFFAALEARGKMSRAAARKRAVESPAAPEGVERIVLPALADALPALYGVLDTLRGRVAVTVLIHAERSRDGSTLAARWSALSRSC